MDIKYSTDTKIEDNSRGFKMQKANFDTEVNTAVSHYFPIILKISHFSFYLFRTLKLKWLMNSKQLKFNKE